MAKDKISRVSQADSLENSPVFPYNLEKERKTKMKSKICLIRHGITRGNRDRLYYGKSDIPLIDDGKAEIARLAEEGIYPDSEDADYYTTGLQRTEQTFGLIYGEKPHDQIELLQEIDFGDYEMKTHAELKVSEEYKRWKHDKSGKLLPPGGESLNMFSERILKGYEELRNRHALKELSMRHSGREAMSIVVCHGGTISAILYHLYPEECEGNLYHWIPDPGHGYVLQLEDEAVTGVEKF